MLKFVNNLKNANQAEDVTLVSKNPTKKILISLKEYNAVLLAAFHRSSKTYAKHSLLEEDTSLNLYPIEKELEIRGIKNSEQIKNFLLTSRETIIIENYQDEDEYWEKVKNYHEDMYVRFKLLIPKQESVEKNSSRQSLFNKRSKSPPSTISKDDIFKNWNSHYFYEIITSPLIKQDENQQEPMKKEQSRINRLKSRLSFTTKRSISPSYPPQPQTVLTSIIENYFDFEKELTQSPPFYFSFYKKKPQTKSDDQVYFNTPKITQDAIEKFNGISNLDLAYKFLENFGSDFPSKFYLGTQKISSNVIKDRVISISLKKESKCIKEVEVKNLNEYGYKSKPKASKLNTITRPSFDSRSGLNKAWLPVWKVVKALYIDRNKDSEQRLTDKDELKENGCLMLLIHAYRELAVRNMIKEERARKGEKQNEKGETTEQVNMEVEEISIDIDFLGIEKFWKESVLNGINKILTKYQIKNNTEPSILNQAKDKIEKFYERSSFTYEMAIRGKLNYWPPLNDENKLTKKIFIFFTHDLIETNFLEWRIWLTTAVQLSKMNEERKNKAEEWKIYLVDLDNEKKNFECDDSFYAECEISHMREYLCNDLKFKATSSNLDLSSCQLLTIDNKLKKELEKSKPKKPFKNLDLSCNFFVNLPKNLFVTNKFKNIINLNLSRNKLIALNEKTFSSLHALTHLDLSYNFIGLEQQELTVNEFNGLSGLFDMNKSLRVLNLSHNCMKRLAVTAFKNLDKLEVLDLSFNEICNLNYKENGENESIDNENDMDEDYEEDSEDENGSVQSLKVFDHDKPKTSTTANLETIKLLASKNKPRIVKMVTKKQKTILTFDNLIELRILNLSENCLESLHKNQFLHNGHLNHLYLSHNRLSDMNSHENDDWIVNVFSKLRRLEILDISYNKLTRLPSFFDKVENVSYFMGLKALCVQHNDLSKLEYNELRDLRRLKIFFAHRNKISYVEKSAFGDLIKLKVFFLYDNIFSENLTPTSQFCVELKKQRKNLKFLLVNHDLGKIRELIMLIKLKKYRNLIENETFQLRQSSSLIN